MDINKLARKIHSANKKKGFWDKKRNEGEVLMLVISELSEMLESDRKIKYKSADPIQLFEIDLARAEKLKYSKKNMIIKKRELFERNVKDTGGDELADAFIRMCDYCIGFKRPINEDEIKNISTSLISVRVFENLGAELLGISCMIGRASDCSGWEISLIFAYMIWLADKLNIPLEKHIKYKMWYNSTRPKKHGKKY